MKKTSYKTKNDRAMVSGVSSILRKIKDKKNRKEVAGSMVKQFNREEVSYNKEKFLKNSRSFQFGGTLPTIYTSNPYDPRIINYGDSLTAYNNDINFDREYFNLVRNANTYDEVWKKKAELERKYPFNRIEPDWRRTKSTTSPIVYRQFPNGDTFKAYDFMGFKKPVQPIEYRDPLAEIKKMKPMGIKEMPASSSFNPVTSVNIPPRREKPLPVVRHTTNYLEPDIIKHKNLDEGFYKEIRQELPKQKVTPEPKEIPVKKQPNKSNPKVVYQNYKKGGILESKKAKLSKLYKAFKLKK